MLPFSSFDLYAHRTSPDLYFVASLNTRFFSSITIFSSKQVPFLIISTGSTPFAESIMYFIVICQANHCPYEVSQSFCVLIRESFDSLPG